jgi:hypothetical protein
MIGGFAMTVLVAAGYYTPELVGSLTHRVVAPFNSLLILCWLIAFVCLSYRPGGRRFAVAVCLLVYFVGLVIL